MYIINTMSRLYIIDFFRGIAVIMMIIFHIFLSFNLFSNKNYDLYSGILKYFGIISRNLFIFISGISLFLSFKNNKKKNFIKKQFNRLITLFISAIIVTILTYIVLPNNYIISGIIHYMFISIFIIVLFINFIEYKYIYLLFLLSLILYINNNNLLFSSNNLLDYFYHVLGFNVFYKPSIDYFPVNKWLWKTILGFIFAKNIDIIKIDNIISKNINLNNFITKIGKNSLFIYLFHIPILYFYNKLI